jgi:hypothetical protein
MLPVLDHAPFRVGGARRTESARDTRTAGAKRAEFPRWWLQMDTPLAGPPFFGSHPQADTPNRS